GIMGNAGLALDLLKPADPIVAMIEDVMRASERAAAVSRQLLAFSGKTGRFVVNPVDLSELISDLAGLAQASISTQVQFRMELDQSVPLVEADATQIRQLALNLIANGAEAIGDASGVVTVSTGVDDLDPAQARNALGAEVISPGRYVYIEVRDDGCGM